MSLIMKSFERTVKNALLSMVHEILDPLQFAYRPGRGVDDATSTILMILSLLEGAETLILLVFIDFSSAFNFIQPHILVKGCRAFTLASVSNAG